MSKNKIKIGIYLCALLMMGVIAVASNIANVAAAFPEIAPATIVAYIISVPCLVVIPMTLVTGKLMQTQAKKTLMIGGISIWLIGGLLPYFLNSMTMILLSRALFGVGIALVQTLCAALVIENFDEPEERNKTMGTMTAFQMLGTIIFSLIAGNLGKYGWNVPFLVHLIALVSLAGAIFFLPYKKPQSIADGGERPKFKASPMLWVWTIAFCFYMIGGQTFANVSSSFLEELNLGDSSAAGNALAIMAFGGLLMGLFFGNFARIFRKMTIVAGIMLQIAGFILIIFSSNLIIFYVGAFLCGLAISVCMPCIFNGAAISVDKNSSGMAISIATCMQNVGLAASPYVAFSLGTILIKSGFSFSFNQAALFGAVIIFSALVLLFVFINVRQKAG